MGFAHAEMIAPAILYAYPGVSREEYAQMLAESSQHTGYPGGFNLGVRSLRGVLGIETTATYKEARQFSKDQYGLPFEPPRLEEDPWKEGHLIVKVHTHNVLGKERYLKIKGSFSKFREGEYFHHDRPPYKMAFVQEVLQQRPVGRDLPYYNSKIKITPFLPVTTKTIYQNEEELAKEWPQFGLDAMYNFAQTKGGFHSFLGSENFWWLCENGKYYLHPRTFNSIPASKAASPEHATENGFTDLVLTAEAFKRREWEILDYKLTRDQLNDFYRRYPEVLGIMNKAIWDAHSSLAARAMGLGTRDFLSARAVGFRY